MLAVATPDECRRSAARALHQALEQAELQVIGHPQMATQEQSQRWTDEPLILECTACKCKGETDTGEICLDGLCHECCDRLNCECWLMSYWDECGEQHEWMCPLWRCEACCDMSPYDCVAMLARNETQARMREVDDSDMEAEPADELLLPTKSLECDHIVLGGGLFSSCRNSSSNSGDEE